VRGRLGVTWSLSENGVELAHLWRKLSAWRDEVRGDLRQKLSNGDPTTLETVRCYGDALDRELEQACGEQRSPHDTGVAPRPHTERRTGARATKKEGNGPMTVEKPIKKSGRRGAGSVFQKLPGTDKP
jgi:hypothetical protein